VSVVGFNALTAAAGGTTFYANSSSEMRLLTVQENECAMAAELRREEAARFMIRDITEGLGRALHYAKVTDDAKLKRVAVDFVLGCGIYKLCDDFVQEAKVWCARGG